MTFFFYSFIIKMSIKKCKCILIVSASCEENDYNGISAGTAWFYCLILC